MKRRRVTSVFWLVLFGWLLFDGLAFGQDEAAKAKDKADQKIVLIRFGSPDRPMEINPFSESFFDRNLEKAKELGADIVVVEIDSPGGYIESSLNIANALRDLKWAHTVAYVPREALSGAAIISIGADDILMHENAMIGDAGPIFQGRDFLFRHAPEKIRSDLVAKVRALCEDTGRPPAIAEAMVDMDLEVFKVTNADTGKVTYKSDAELAALDDQDQMDWKKGALLEASKEGQFLEVTGQKAVEIELANEISNSRAAVAKKFGRNVDDIIVLERTWVDTLVTVLNSWIVMALLLIIGLIAIYLEMAAPGIGIGGLVSGLCFGLFFWSQFLGGTAGWLEVVLFLAGIAFLLVEIFVLPGFGVAGLTGLLLMGASIIMATQRFAGADGVATDDLLRSLMILTGSAVASMIGMYLASKYFGGLALFKRMTLEPPTPVVAVGGTLASGSSTEDKPAIAIGDVGVADSSLRPSGRVLFGESYRDVIADGSFVDKGKQVRVTKVSGIHITVREVEES